MSETQDAIDPALAPVLERMRTVTTAGDERTDEEALTELAQLTTVITGRLGLEAGERRRGEAWADLQRLREAVAGGNIGAAPRLAEAVASVRKALGLEHAITPAAERVLARMTRGPLLHMPTGLASWDEASRGGLLTRRVHVIAGEPDSGKTALAHQLALHWARLGYAVVWLAVDEPRDGIEDRIGQAHGLALEDLEAGDGVAVSTLAGVLRDLPQLQILDQEEDHVVIEDAVRELLAHARRIGAPGAVLVVDSIQTATCRAASTAARPLQERERIDAVVAALKAAARSGVLVLATSETGRGSYRARSAKDRTAEMAAAKGSGSIEFAALTQVVLSRIGKGEYAGDVRVGFAKNKRGAAQWKNGTAFRLERDPDRCTYLDRGRIGDDAPEERQAPKKPTEENLEPYLGRLRKTLAGLPHGFNGSRDDLVRLAGGKAALTRAALALLITRREVAIERPQGEPARIRMRTAADQLTAPDEAPEEHR